MSCHIHEAHALPLRCSQLAPQGADLYHFETKSPSSLFPASSRVIVLSPRP